jgi:hypothetical protein
MSWEKMQGKSRAEAIGGKFLWRRKGKNGDFSRDNGRPAPSTIIGAAVAGDMKTQFPWFFWLFVAAFGIHNFEEALLLPAWSRTAGKFHKRVGTFEFVFALIVLTALSVVITVLFHSAGKQSLPAYLYFAFNFGMLVNVVFPHLTATIAMNKYCPGLLTGLLLVAPTTTLILLYGHEHAFFLFPKFWLVAIPFAVLLVSLIPVLFALGRKLQRLS